jgi:hypothetical protein
MNAYTQFLRKGPVPLRKRKRTREEREEDNLEAAAEEAKEAEEVDPVEDNLNSKSEALDGQDELAVPEDVEGVRNADGT